MSVRRGPVLVGAFVFGLALFAAAWMHQASRLTLPPSPALPEPLRWDHRESPVLPAVALVKARGDGTLGERLRRSGETCAPITPPRALRTLWPVPSVKSDGSQSIPPDEAGVGYSCMALVAPGWLAARRITMPELATKLSRLVNRRVNDQTGLSGEYDVDLEFAPPHRSVATTSRPASASDAPVAPALLSALRVQLGLTLEEPRPDSTPGQD